MSLLDVNVLLALAWPNHLHHDAAHDWFAQHRRDGWATCPFTEAAFVRLSSMPVVVNTAVTAREALQLLQENTAASDHSFWPNSTRIPELLPEIRERLIGHQQVNDAILLDLAIRTAGVLVSFDRRIAALLAPGSEHASALEVVRVSE